MAMVITMRMVARFFFFATEVTQGPLLSAHYTYIKRPPNSRCVFPSGLEDTAKMTAHSRATGLPDLAGDRACVCVVCVCVCACACFSIFNLTSLFPFFFLF